MALTLFLIPGAWLWTLAATVAVLAVLGFFRTFKDLEARHQRELLERDRTVQGLRGEVKQLRIRPYEAEHCRVAEEKLAKVGVNGRNLLRYLLHLGPTEQPKMFADAKMEHATFVRSLEVVERTRLIVAHVDARRGPGQITISWEINPAFVEVLKELLFPRQEGEGSSPHFPSTALSFPLPRTPRD